MPAEMSASHPETRLRILSQALHGHSVCVLHQDLAHRFDLAENLPESWSGRPLMGLTETDVFPPETAAQFVAAHDACTRDNSERLIEADLWDGRRFQFKLLPDAAGVTTVITDITDDRARDTAMRSLLREVSHRSKNLLAIVQSVAMQTAHHSATTQDFLDKFRGRLHALSSTQDLVTESNWRGTWLQSLVTSQLTRVDPAVLAHVRVTGENPLLGPNASLHIGLAIHELGANALLHGALANGNPGHIWIDVQLLQRPGQPRELALEWQETGIAGATRLHEPHFGSLVLERIVPLSVGGQAELIIETDSVRYRLVVPADQFEA